MRREEKALHHIYRSLEPLQSSTGVCIYRTAIPSSHSKILHPRLILSIHISLHLLTAPPPLVILSPLLSTLLYA